MIVRVSIISLLLVSSPVFSMENVLDNKSEYQSIDLSETTGNTNCITSLQSWKAFAQENECLDDYEVSPQAVAEFQHNYEIKTDLPILPEAITVWSSVQWTKGYTLEVARMHTFLRSGKDVQDKAELTELKNLCIKKAYMQLAKNKQVLTSQQKSFECKRQCGIVMPVIAGVIFIAWILEMAFLLPIKSAH